MWRAVWPAQDLRKQLNRVHSRSEQPGASPPASFHVSKSHRKLANKIPGPLEEIRPESASEGAAHTAQAQEAVYRERWFSRELGGDFCF